jgi:hypothetical protein
MSQYIPLYNYYMLINVNLNFFLNDHISPLLLLFFNFFSLKLCQN